ncbi:MAG: PTO1314 family radical SAM protein [Candidatus Bathyarchaeia archaeon]
MKNTAHNYQETLRLGLRLYRGFLLNSFGVKAPLFGGHKLTYNCNLKCKMCPFWKRSSENLSTQKEKEILKQIYDSGACGIGFEGGEPLLRKDLTEILAYSRSLPLHTSLVTNGTLLKSRIDEIAPYINGIVFVSLDGLEKTHDLIRGVNGCFKEAVQGITAAKRKVSVTINMTIMADNIHEVEDTVKLAKDLGVRIVLSVAHEYCNANASSPQADEIKKIAKQLIELKRKGYPIMNSINYFKVMAKEKNWQCKPWAMVNIDPYGNVVLPCYVHNDYYASSVSIFETGIKSAVSGFDWEKIKNCRKCSLHCYVEPSLVLSGDFRAYMHWAFHVSI